MPTTFGVGTPAAESGGPSGTPSTAQPVGSDLSPSDLVAWHDDHWTMLTLFQSPNESLVGSIGQREWCKRSYGQPTV